MTSHIITHCALSTVNDNIWTIFFWWLARARSQSFAGGYVSSRTKSHQIWRRKSVLKMDAMSCVGCRFLNLSKEQEEHIIQRHFRRRDWQDIDPGESFFHKSISPEEIFRELLMIPRFQLRGSWGRRSRFVYHYGFNIDVGVFPKQHGPTRTTKRVEIVCACVQCPVCRVHPPTEIVTVYPVHWWELTVGW